MSPEETLASINSYLEITSASVERNNQLLSAILSKLQDRDKKEENVLFREVVVPADNEIKSMIVNNKGFSRARIFLDAGFTKAHTGGISVSLLYKNSIMGPIMDLISSNGSCGKASEPIDISNLPGFNFLIRNNDTSNDTTVTNFRIVLYNDHK